MMQFNKYITIKKEDIEILIVSVLLCFMSVINISGKYIYSYPSYVTFMAVILIGYCLINIKYILSVKNILFGIFLVAYGLTMLYSNFSHRYLQYVSNRSNVTQVLQYVLPFFVLMILKEKNYFSNAVKDIWVILAAMVVVTDVHAILTGAKYQSLIGSYLVGNKFLICYMHFYMLGFFMYFWNKDSMWDRIKMLLMYILATLVAVYTECSTAIVALAFFLAVYIVRNKVWPFMKNPVLAFLLMIISNLILIVFPAVLNWGPVKYVLIRILGEDPTLTGRVRGYARMLPALSYNLMWGNGYFNNYMVSKYFTNMDDLQNGLADVTLSFGVIGLVFLIVLFFIAFKRGAGDKSMGFMFIVYMFMIVSSVEITLNMKFVVMLAFVMACEKEKVGDVSENRYFIHAKSY